MSQEELCYRGYVLKRQILALGLVALAACSGRITDGTALGFNSTSGVQGGANGGSSANGSGAGRSGGKGGTDGSGSGTLCSPAEARPSAAPIRRFTATEYNLSLHDLFPGVTLADQTIAADPLVNGFNNNASAQSPSPLLIEQLRNAAIAVSEAALTKLSAWAPCTSAGGRRCATQIATTLGEKAYRRPLTQTETSDLEAFAGGAFDDYGFDVAVRMTIEGVLQTPQFFYRAEFGDATKAENGLVPLTGYELASRLSFALWRTIPDTALLDAAKNGALDTTAGVEAQAKRLLADPRAKDAVADFHTQWFNLAGLKQFQPDAMLFPEYTDGVRQAVIESTARFLDYAFWDVGTVEALLTDRTVFANDDMAKVYGLPLPGSAELKPVQAPANQRAGILTQPGLLASTSHPNVHSPIKRGVFVRSAMLCSPLPPPPANVSTVLKPTDPNKPRTIRQHIEETHVSPECVGCHDSIDGIGFAFENFDAIGRYRTEDNGLPVNPKGSLIGIPGIDKGDVADAVDLAALMASAQQTRDCVAAHWFRYTLGRSDNDDAAQCEVKRLGASLATGGGDMQAMLLELIASDAFRYRPAP